MSMDMQRCAWRPNLFIVGAPKCGTTSLCTYLGRHPDVFFARQKEPLFFCSDQSHEEPWRSRGRAEYLSLFEAGAERSWRGEGSVWYLSSTVAARRIAACCPDARIIIMLRNPVDMALSLHAQFLFSGNETIRNFDAAYAAQSARRQGRDIPWRAHMPEGLLYSDVGRYARQVERYLKTFPDGQVKVLIFEEFFGDPAQGYRELLGFLGLDQDAATAQSFKPENRRHRLRSVLLQRLLTKAPELWSVAGKLPPGRARNAARRWLRTAASRLHDYNTNAVSSEAEGPSRADRHCRYMPDFADDISRLEGLLNRDLSIWRQHA